MRHTNKKQVRASAVSDNSVVVGLYVHVFCVHLQQSLTFVCRVLRVLDLGCVNIRNYCPDFRIKPLVAVTFICSYYVCNILGYLDFLGRGSWNGQL